ncbi:tRNA lysidine(34) synthetase TilS [Cohnella boryungensis]|uniref:tRNA lysidine(34) synthetase TilS n=1 Tax=Cohnella boryungensis TaxID=768479 RepID=UPI00366EB349
MRPQEEWVGEFGHRARADGWWRDGATVVAAVSGGPDSMALLHLLKGLADGEPGRIVVAHANHQFRGAESDAEAELVRRTTTEWGMPLETVCLGMPEFLAETGMNAQSAAREKRYGFLMDVSKKYGAGCLLTAHHADDQAETVLMRVIRGTGIGGLAGIRYRRGEQQLELIRPLLRITKCELLDYCKRNGVPYAVDSSNVDRHYFRNAVRLDLMPLLEQYNPRLKESLTRLADMAAADDDYMEEQTLRVFREAVFPSGEGFRLERRRFRGLHVALQRRLIKLILNCSSNPRQMLDFRQVEEVLAALEQERPTTLLLDIGDGWVMRREYEEAYIGPAESAPMRFAYIVTEATDKIAIEETGALVKLERMDGAIRGVRDNRDEACFDADSLEYPLRIRNRLPGDRMRPYGLNGTKKVQDMFVDAKVPPTLRDKLALLVDAEGRVLWIPGIRRSGHALVGGATRRTLRVSYSAPEN